MLAPLVLGVKLTEVEARHDQRRFISTTSLLGHIIWIVLVDSGGPFQRIFDRTAIIDVVFVVREFFRMHHGVA